MIDKKTIVMNNFFKIDCPDLSQETIEGAYKKGFLRGSERSDILNERIKQLKLENEELNDSIELLHLTLKSTMQELEELRE